MYFHNGDFIPTNQFHDHECLKEFVHVTNLKVNHYLFHEDPLLIAYHDGVLISLDQRFDHIDLYNEKHELIQSFPLTFITYCEELVEDQTINSIERTSFNKHVLIPVFVLFILVVLILMLFRKERKREN